MHRDRGAKEGACQWTEQEGAGRGREGPCLSDPAGHGVCVGRPQGHVEHNHSVHNNEDGHHQEEGQVPAGTGWGGQEAGWPFSTTYPAANPIPAAAPPDPLGEGWHWEGGRRAVPKKGGGGGGRQAGGPALLADEWHCLGGLRHLLSHEEEENGLGQEHVDGHGTLLATRWG